MTTSRPDSGVSAAADSPRLSPPTVIVVHRKEKRSKCSVEPLRERPEFLFTQFPASKPYGPLSGYVRLGIGGPLLSPQDADNGLLVLDATWRLAARMEEDYQSIPVRSLLNWRTAYPRTSKMFEDPGAGLATIEAIYAAFLQLGRPVDGLLDQYRWRDEFLKLNAELITQVGDLP